MASKGAVTYSELMEMTLSDLEIVSAEIIAIHGESSNG